MVIINFGKAQEDIFDKGLNTGGPLISLENSDFPRRLLAETLGLGGKATRKIACESCKPSFEPPRFFPRQQIAILQATGSKASRCR